jgi:hypothetical protein
MAHDNGDLTHSVERTRPSRARRTLEGYVVRHLAVGQACPMDGAVVGRAHCSGCPSFVSYRLSGDVATVGCDWGQDVAAWLRREMRRRAPAARPPPSRPGRPPGLAPGTSFGIFLAAVGVGLVLSAFERPA